MKKSLLIPATATAAILLLTGCSGGGSATDEATPSVADASAVFPVEGIDCVEGAEPTGDPIVVGGSLSLTGALAPTGAVHNAVAELVADWVNGCGGIDGRPLEWKVLDDQSTPAQAASNYERLINDGVDLVMGPYGGANTLAAAGPVGRAGYAFPTATNGAPDQLIGDFHFPAWQMGDGADTVESIFAPSAQTLWDALESTGNPPKTAFYAVAKFPTTISFSGATRTAFEDNGVETLGDVQYDVGTTDFSSLALRIQQADPDYLYLGSLGGDISSIYDAFANIGYQPRGVYATLPAPAAVAQLGPEVEGLMILSLYENDSALADNPIAQYFAELYYKKAAENDVMPIIETQAAASLGAWQILLSAVEEVGPDNAAIIEYLHSNEVATIAGTFGFDGWNGYTTDVNRVTQIQNGERVLVWPEDVAAAKPIL